MMARARSIRGQGLPYIVACRADKVVGYAYASEYRSRPGYHLTVEDSVYVDPDVKRYGVGKLLLDEIVKKCTAFGKRRIIAISSGDGYDNAGSIRLHKAAGFVYVGVLKNVGLKSDRFIDTHILQRSLEA